MGVPQYVIALITENDLLNNLNKERIAVIAFPPRIGGDHINLWCNTNWNNHKLFADRNYAKIMFI